jgi:ABC-type branched-subunit amino acid transport system ATPase component
MNERSSACTGRGLHVSDLTVRYGGLTAVDGVNLVAPVGEITGLIGPNGAGKTTTFNACSGFTTARQGRVLLHGHDVTHRSPAVHAQYGMGRTFQIMELFDSLTVAQNVGLGLEAKLAAGLPWRQLVSTRNSDRLVREATRRSLALCGIEQVADRRPGDLSTGQRRLVELARAVAGDFSMLLLDEPSSGLDVAETQQFGTVLRGIVAGGTTGILLVEHDMSLALGISDYCYVLDFGHLIFEGTPQQIAASEVVRSAYLGAA